MWVEDKLVWGNLIAHMIVVFSEVKMIYPEISSSPLGGFLRFLGELGGQRVR